MKLTTAKSSYRTYEEWKHINLIIPYNRLFSSYRTYEEWKRFSLTQSELSVLRSYRTYEEWKLDLKSTTLPVELQFLPYL